MKGCQPYLKLKIKKRRVKLGLYLLCQKLSLPQTNMTILGFPRKKLFLVVIPSGTFLMDHPVYTFTKDYPMKTIFDYVVDHVK